MKPTLHPALKQIVQALGELLAILSEYTEMLISKELQHLQIMWESSKNGKGSHSLLSVLVLGMSMMNQMLKESLIKNSDAPSSSVSQDNAKRAAALPTITLAPHLHFPRREDIKPVIGFEPPHKRQGMADIEHVKRPRPSKEDSDDHIKRNAPLATIFQTVWGQGTFYECTGIWTFASLVGNPTANTSSGMASPLQTGVGASILSLWQCLPDTDVLSRSCTTSGRRKARSTRDHNYDAQSLSHSAMSFLEWFDYKSYQRCWVSTNSNVTIMAICLCHSALQLQAL